LKEQNQKDQQKAGQESGAHFTKGFLLVLVLTAVFDVIPGGRTMWSSCLRASLSISLARWRPLGKARTVSVRTPFLRTILPGCTLK